MASTSGCLHDLQDLQLSDTSCSTDDSSNKSDLATLCGSEAVPEIPSTLYFSAVEDQIERSKAHWSTLVDHSSDSDEEKEDFVVSNKKEFQALQSDPTWGSFFSNFTGDGMAMGGCDENSGDLVVGEKFAEGGQAMLFNVQIKWNDARTIQDDQKYRREYVLKVFKKGTFLKHLKTKFPQSMLLDYIQRQKNMMSAAPQLVPGYCSRLFGGVLLNDGRFALLMRKRYSDLRAMIEHMTLEKSGEDRGKRHFDLRKMFEHMTLKKSGEDRGPFSKDQAELIMYHIALGVDWLHSRGIIHRDLKSANILVHPLKSGWPGCLFYLADYECSIGIVGTTFFRAPEILKALKEGKRYKRPEVFSKAADVYSYGMVCYEVLTGKLPLEDYPLSYSRELLNDRVINEHLRPAVPKYVEDWTLGLLNGCWQSDPSKRPRFDDILEIFLTNSTTAQRHLSWLKEQFGENYRGHYIEV